MTRANGIPSRRIGARGCYLPLLCLVASLIACDPLFAQETFRVRYADDSGLLTFRDAIEQANQHPGEAHKILFDEGLTINLLSPVEYVGTNSIEIAGKGSGFSDGSPPSVGAVFKSLGGASLQMSDLTFDCVSLVSSAPSYRIGDTSIVLNGIHVGCSQGMAITSGVSITNDGFGDTEIALLDVEIADHFIGFAVNDRGPGSVEFRAANSRFNGNRFGSLVMNESDDGSMSIELRKTDFVDSGTTNGTYFSYFPSSANKYGLSVAESGNGDLQVRIEHAPGNTVKQDPVQIVKAGPGSVHFVQNGGTYGDLTATALNFRSADGYMEVQLTDVLFDKVTVGHASGATLAGLPRGTSGAVHMTCSVSASCKAIVENSTFRKTGPNAIVTSGGAPGNELRLFLDNVVFEDNRNDLFTRLTVVRRN